jgi:hypothetical protein
MAMAMGSVVAMTFAARPAADTLSSFGFPLQQRGQRSNQGQGRGEPEQAPAGCLPRLHHGQPIE